MILALIDNGSLEPASTLNLRSVAAALTRRCDAEVHPVSWKHSDRIAPTDLGGIPARTLNAFVREHLARGERRFLFVPFFISAQGAIGSALRHDLEALQADLPRFDYTFIPGLAALRIIPRIVAGRIRDTLTATGLAHPPVVLVDHGGPARASADLRDRLSREIRTELGPEVRSLTAASMEGSFPPLLTDILRASSLAGHAIIVAPLFLSPGRHAGPGGDIARICGETPVRCHLTELIGTHPLALDALASALQPALVQFHNPSFA